MASKKVIKVHNKSDKPDNIILKENEIIENVWKSRIHSRDL